MPLRTFFTLDMLVAAFLAPMQCPSGLDMLVAA